MTEQPPNNGRRTRYGSTVPLPKELAEVLSPTRKRALRHSMRRRILRTLNRDLVPWTADELAAIFPGCGLSIVNYHVLVLEDCGAVSVSYLEPQRGRLLRTYVTNVSDNPEIASALQATIELDEGR
jgi:hypothetical protein